jgi:hypothetical protein
MTARRTEERKKHAMMMKVRKNTMDHVLFR